MRIPKRFKLHRAAGEDTPSLRLDIIRRVGDALVATDAVIVASIPLGAGGVELAPGEELPEGAQINPDAWAEATAGTREDGSIEMRFGAQVARCRPGSAAVMVPPPVDRRDLEVPPAAACVAEAHEVPLRRSFVEVILDADALARLSQALGAREGVRLRFDVGDPVGSSDPSRGPVYPCSSQMVAVEPAEGGGARGLIVPVRREGHS